MMKKFINILAGVTVFFASTTAQSHAFESQIEFRKLEGKVLVSQGDGFYPALPGTSLKVGDKIVVGNSSGATLVHDDCSVELAAETVFIVPASRFCAKGETVALVQGVFITPTATDPLAIRLDRMIDTYSLRQKKANKTGKTDLSSCLSPKVTDMISLRNYWLRNPGIDPTTMIDELDVDATSCGNVETVKTARVTKKPAVIEPVVTTEQAPIANSPKVANGGVFGGTKGSTIAVAGAAGLAALGLGAALLLSDDDDGPISQQ